MEILSLRLFILVVFSLAISIIDIKKLRIPDALLISCFVLLVFFDITGNQNILNGYSFLPQLSAAFLWFAVFYAIHVYTDGLGFGDVKYAALLGYALGLEKSIIAFLFTAFSAIFLYIIGIHVFKWEKTAKLPFAPFLTFGALAAELLKF